ncbi:MAG: WYL domain-containing protein [Hyphomonadaceae bacterium]|jgi:predicted DNA-binding transcriptional regulator YafY|nr:WYL domain-containing protein [Hyphomonadaceae bacterium]
MRHEKTALLIELARELAASRRGLTLDEMGEKIGTKRRTTERMRDQLLELFPDIEEVSDPPSKRWRMARMADTFLVKPDADELAALAGARALLAKSNPAAGEALTRLEGKIRSLISRDLRRLEPDIEALMQAEELAVQPGARALADPAKLKVLRKALLELKQVRFAYAGGSAPGKRRVVIPYGLLFGGEVYLVAHEVNAANPMLPRMWRLDRIEAPVVTDAPGGPPDDFSLKAFSERSFGVFQDDRTMDVVLKVEPHAVEEARRWQFHPTQRFEDQPDGSLIVRLHGGGMRELAWSLFRWGGKLRVLEPKDLRRELRGALEAAGEMAKEG